MKFQLTFHSCQIFQCIMGSVFPDHLGIRNITFTNFISLFGHILWVIRIVVWLRVNGLLVVDDILVPSAQLAANALISLLMCANLSEQYLLVYAM